ncbi:hypothetical protein ACFFNY_25295 [Paenibacillus hodogayensis]|uniref:DUF3993 domain-containing protein n=1 Tax=Paenibacillus hodogayensis TaxID=279208 RepID=A0ABV5W347_9BACL
MNKRLMAVVLVLVTFLTGCGQNRTEIDLTTWDEKKVFAFLKEVHQYVKTIPLETTSRDQIVKKYETYFSPELSRKIFDSLYDKTGNVWKVPDGDAGYIFVVLGGEQDGGKVKVEFDKDHIVIRETYEMGMYSAVQYTIRYTDKPVITDWKQE